MAPGPVETPINDPFNWNNPKGDAHRKFLSERTPSKVSFYKVADMLGTALYLASDDSAAVTGVTIPVDGGWCAWWGEGCNHEGRGLLRARDARSTAGRRGESR